MMIFYKKKIMNEKYFIAKLYYEFPDEETGKVKKVKEEKLVKGYSPTDVEAKITKRYTVS